MCLARRKNRCDIVPTGYRAVRVGMNSLCEQHGGPVPANYRAWGMHPVLLPAPAAVQLGGAGARSSLAEARNSSLHIFVT